MLFPVLFGLGAEFDRLMLFYLSLYYASFALYLIPFVVAVLLWRKGWARIAGGIVIATVFLGVGVPLLDQWKDARDKGAIARSEVRPVSLDLSGKDILVIGRVCIDFCKAILRYGEVGTVSLASPDRAQWAQIAGTGILPSDVNVNRITLPALDVKKTAASLPALSDVDYILVIRPSLAATPLFQHLYPHSVHPENVRISYLLASSADATRLGDLSPELLTLMHEDRSFRVPFHPAWITRYDRLDFEEEREYTFGLFCDNPKASAVKYCKR